MTTDHSAFYLYRGELVMEFQERIRRIHRVLLDDLPKGQDISKTVPGETRFSPEAQMIIFSIIDMLDDILNIPPRHCLDPLTADNIVFTRDGQPRLVGVALVTYSEALAESNYKSLADIIEHRILSSSKLAIPIEVKHLLHLMRKEAIAMAYAINYHSSLVPMELRNYMYLKLFQYVYGIMYRSPDLEALMSVLNNLLFDPEWATKIKARNRFLDDYLKRADYDPKGATPGRLPGLEVMRYGRNGPEHPFDAALDLTSPFASRFCSRDIAHMFYANLPLLLCSLSAALYRQGRLRYLNLRAFFTNLPKPVAAPADGFNFVEQSQQRLLEA